MQFVDCTAKRALCAITFPDFELDVRRNDASSLCIYVDGLIKVFIFFNRDELEFVNNSELVASGPRVHKVEDAVI